MFNGYLNFIIESYTEKILEKTKNEILAKNKLGSLTKLRLICKSYERSFGNSEVVNSLVEVIFVKKADFILEATTIAELHLINKPSIPAYNYVKMVQDSEYHVVEEEFLFWSKTSLVVKLNSSSCERYMELFEILLPEQHKLLFKK